MQKLLIVIPWVPALCAALYIYDRWKRIPVHIAVTFFQGNPSGWSSKATALPLMLGLMFGLLAFFTALLLMPHKIHDRRPAATSLMGSPEAPLIDEQSNRVMRLRVVMTAHWAAGFLIPLSVWHVVSWNLRR